MSNNQGVELLPCPFCGGEAMRVETKRAVSFGCDNNECIVTCHSGGPLDSEEACLAAWNTRTTPASAGVLVEALRLARPIVEQDWLSAKDYADADWEGTSWTALEAIDQALSATATPASDGKETLEEQWLRVGQAIRDSNIEPTEAMWSAAWDASEDYFCSDKVTKEGFRRGIQAMLAAAPKVTLDRFGEGYRAGVEASAKVADEASLNSKRMEERQLNDAEQSHSLAGREVSLESAAGFAKRASAASAIATAIRALQPDAGEGA